MKLLCDLTLEELKTLLKEYGQPLFRVKKL